MSLSHQLVEEKRDAAWRELVAKRARAASSSKDYDSIVHLNVGGTRFVMLRSTLAKYPDSMLGRMFSADWKNRPALMLDGAVFVDRSPRLFEHVLEALRGSSSPANYRAWSRNCSESEWHEELIYYGLASGGPLEDAEFHDVAKDTCWRLAASFAEQMLATPLYRQLQQRMIVALHNSINFCLTDGQLVLTGGRSETGIDAADWLRHVVSYATVLEEDLRQDGNLGRAGLSLLAVDALCKDIFVTRYLAKQFGARSAKIRLAWNGAKSVGPPPEVASLDLVGAPVNPPSDSAVFRIELEWNRI